MKFLEYALEELTSKEGYTALFKAFIVVSALYLVSLIQVADLTIPIEADAHKYKFAVEYELETELSFEKLDCNFEMKSYEACKMAVYKNNLSEVSIKALTCFQGLLKALAILTGILSVFGFFLCPYVTKET